MPIKHRKKETSYAEFLLFIDALHEYAEHSTRSNKQVFKDIETLLWLMYYTGARIAEILAVNATDWDKEKHLLHINKSVGATSQATRQIITTKTPQSVRDIPLTDQAEMVLADLVSRSHSEPLLASPDGLPYEIDYISNIIANISRASGITFNAYMLRHLFSTELFRAGTDPAVIRDLMGHTSRSMSLDYAKSSFADRTEAIRRRK